GNKRSGFMAAGLFLEFNGQRLQAPETEAVLQTVALAAGELSREDFSLWLELHSQPFSLK
ncbi:MAG: type II toxin-antitoxin system death-on-curing family toxin, partial [Kiritimatiellia bacterium]